MNKKLLSEMIMMLAGCWSHRDSPDDRSFFENKKVNKKRLQTNVYTVCVCNTQPIQSS